MKQIISISEIATIYRAVNETIAKISEPFKPMYAEDPKEVLRRHKELLKKNSYYQSLLRVKKTLENCNLEIEAPDIKVEDKPMLELKQLINLKKEVYENENFNK